MILKVFCPEITHVTSIRNVGQSTPAATLAMAEFKRARA